MLKFWKGAIVTASCYFISLMIAFCLYNIIFDLPFDRNRIVSGIFVGAFVTIIPYVLLGMFIIRLNTRTPLRDSFFIGLFIVSSERLSLYLIGWTFVSARTDGWTYDNLLSPVNFVWAEALPYFTPFYIIVGGIISLIICVLTTFLSLKMLNKKDYEHTKFQL